jgi:hypothetical protein
VRGPSAQGFCGLLVVRPQPAALLLANCIDMQKSTSRIQTRLSMLNLTARTNHLMETP